ncbi:hypothetical protein GN156_09515 [bacterium LRH843]|nr:hypothetical protein [bacterium LRH843]
MATIVAVVTSNEERAKGGGAPVFIVKDHDALQKVGGSLEKILDCTAHEITDDTLIIVER